ncbi:MAG: hypothetical protein JRJ87_01255 [Deltaproteobacteria bacterium]|nr:hypothetical protein [Deltaproteobacteria bacterium]
MKLKIGTPEHFKWLKGIVATTIILNVIDGILTIMWVFSGRATEANPLMSQLIEANPVLFISVKMALVFLGTILLWRLRQRALAVIGIFVAFMVYYAVLIYHLSEMNLHLIGRLFD